mmetsp:Transcript_1264/g.5615  ORF Transcript_1264/g.5615 Transcript_1264/m.5615 type:complete len:210 (+) Transcript_1264:3144-3773(+)
MATLSSCATLSLRSLSHSPATSPSLCAVSVRSCSMRFLRSTLRVSRSPRRFASLATATALTSVTSSKPCALSRASARLLVLTCVSSAVGSGSGSGSMRLGSSASRLALSRAAMRARLAATRSSLSPDSSLRAISASSIIIMAGLEVDASASGSGGASGLVGSVVSGSSTTVSSAVSSVASSTGSDAATSGGAPSSAGASPSVVMMRSAT